MYKHKKNFLKVPRGVLGKIGGFKKPDLIVACVRRIPRAKIVSGEFRHLGLEIQNGQLVCASATLPDPSVGRYSRYNVLGRTLVLKDRPKVSKFITITVPN